MTELSLAANIVPACTVLSFEDAVGRLRSTRELRSEAAAIAAAHGPNAYSDFLLKHGRRPDRHDAAAMGRLVGRRLRAADGSLQPRQLRRLRKSKKGRAEDSGVDQILRLRSALANLAANEGDPADIIQYVDPLFDDDSVIRDQLAHAVRWINKFAEEWGREQETRGGPRSF